MTCIVIQIGKFNRGIVFHRKSQFSFFLITDESCTWYFYMVPYQQVVVPAGIIRGLVSIKQISRKLLSFYNMRTMKEARHYKYNSALRTYDSKWRLRRIETIFFYFIIIYIIIYLGAKTKLVSMSIMSSKIRYISRHSCIILQTVKITLCRLITTIRILSSATF